MTEDLGLFLNENTKAFVSWLENVLEKLKKVSFGKLLKVLISIKWFIFFNSFSDKSSKKKKKEEKKAAKKAKKEKKKEKKEKKKARKERGESGDEEEEDEDAEDGDGVEGQEAPIEDSTDGELNSSKEEVDDPEIWYDI